MFEKRKGKQTASEKKFPILHTQEYEADYPSSLSNIIGRRQRNGRKTNISRN